MEAYSDIFVQQKKRYDLIKTDGVDFEPAIANADVDNYKSRDFDFKKIMSKELAGKLQSSHPAYLR